MGAGWLAHMRFCEPLARDRLHLVAIEGHALKPPASGPHQQRCALLGGG